FGDRVKKWTTFNEPIVPVEMGYLNHYHYPCVVDMKRATVVAFHSMLASAKTIEAYHNLNLDGEIGVILNLTPSYALSDAPADTKADHIADSIYNRTILAPFVLGEYSADLIEFSKELHMLPPVHDCELGTINPSRVDFLGVRYYQPRRVQAKETPVDS